MLFGAAVVALLMVSSATAINMNKTENNNESLENKNSTNDNEIYVDPNIKLTKAQLPKLKQAYEKIEDPEYKELTLKIIQKLETQEIVKSDDLKDILIELNMQNTEIHTGKIVGSACCYSHMIGFPVIPLFMFWIGPGLFIQWSADGDEININIGALSHHITGKHHGFALAFVGFWHSCWWGSPFPEGEEFSVFGWSPLIVVTYD